MFVRYDPSETVLKAQFEILKAALSWDVDRVSKRVLRISAVDGGNAISGHNGEFLGVMCGAWGAFLRHGWHEMANEAEQMIRMELEREAAAFRYLRNTRSSVKSDAALLKMAAILTHNVGDVDQGLSYWEWAYDGKTSMSTKKSVSMPEKQPSSVPSGDREGKDGIGGSHNVSLEEQDPFYEQRQRYSRLAHERGVYMG